MEKPHEPLIRKGREIFKVVGEIGDLIPEDNAKLQSVKGMMIADAATLTAKVNGAEGAGLYDIKMENAAIIRKAARELMLHNHSLEMFGFEYTDYYDIVRELIEEYRLLFIRWVESFDPWEYTIDRWGLFNPPGVGPHDKDPDEDIPGDDEEGE
ncbi:MAG: hypothetical protein ACQEQ0_11560 [Bacteroidota bacterium]